MSLYDILKSRDNPSKGFQYLLIDRAIKQHALMSCTIELTPICNFRCPFCYARKSREELADKGIQLPTVDQWKGILDQLSDMGLMNLSLTGGECTLLPGFCELYEYAYNKGFVMSVFTNGSAISDEILSLFRRCPPGRIYITLYGAEAQTYETVCGSSHFYELVHKNIKALKAEGHQLIAQFTAANSNLQDFDSVYRFSKELDIPLRYGSDFVQYGNCTDEVIEANQANTDVFNEKVRAIWRENEGVSMAEYEEKIMNGRYIPRKFEGTPPKGVSCNAGRSACFLRWDWKMFPCVSWDAKAISFRERSLQSCWQEMVQWAEEAPCLAECINCIHRIHCIQCMASHYNDTHELGKPSPRLCWKVTHPERAAIAEAFYAEHGYLRDEDARA